MTNYDYTTHLDRTHGVYHEKTKLLLELAERHLAPDITWESTEGGLFLWCRLPDDIGMMNFRYKAMERTVCVVPGNAFLVDETQLCQSFRINHAAPTDEQLVKGIEILGQLTKELRTK